MIDKVKKVLTIILIALVVIGIVYGIIKIIINYSKGKDLITSEEVCLYTIDSNIETQYNTYYYIDSCIKNIFESCRLERYGQLLDLYVNDYQKQYTDEEKIDKLKQISSEVIEQQEDKINFNYVLEKIYRTNDKSLKIYIVQLQIGEQTTYLIIDLEDVNKYSYKFAFIK